MRIKSFCLSIGAFVTICAYSQNTPMSEEDTARPTIVVFVPNVSHSDSALKSFTNVMNKEFSENLLGIFEGTLYDFDSARIEKRKKERIYLTKMAPIAEKVTRWCNEYVQKGKSNIIITKKELKLWHGLVDKIEKNKLDKDLVASYIYNIPFLIKPDNVPTRTYYPNGDYRTYNNYQTGL